MSIGSEMFKKNLKQVESNAMFNLVEDIEPVKKNSEDDLLELHPNNFLKNINDKDEDVDYLADSDSITDFNN